MLTKEKYTTGLSHKWESHLCQAVINILQSQLTEKGVGNTGKSGIYFHFTNQPSCHHRQQSSTWSTTLKETRRIKVASSFCSARSRRALEQKQELLL